MRSDVDGIKVENMDTSGKVANLMLDIDGIQSIVQKDIVRNIANLAKVKTVVTLVVIAGFAVLALSDRLPSDNVMLVVSMVVSFYFGTQHEKKSNT